MNGTPAWLRVVAYRIGQVRQQLGFVPPLSPEDIQEVQRWLPTSALPLFYTMSNADKQHSLRVCRGLQSQGCSERTMLAAALLHDVGKAQGRVPFWTRPVIVLGKSLAPSLLKKVILPLEQIRVGTDSSRPARQTQKKLNDITHRTGLISSHPVRALQAGTGCDEIRPVQRVVAWRRALSYAWWHAEIGADLAEDAGLSERAVLYIRTHHQPHGPAAALHHVDEVS